MFNGRQTENSEQQITGGTFWGGVSVSEFQESRAIPLQIPLPLIKEALIYALHSVELDLQETAEHYRQSGIERVSDLDLPQINGSNRLQMLFKKAVFARAKAEILPEFATLSARELHENRNSVNEQKALHAEATMAIRAIKGKPRGGVHFI